MAVVLAAGFDGDDIRAEASMSGTPTLVAGRNGGSAFRCTNGSSVGFFSRGAGTGTAGTPAYRSYRFYMKLEQYPATTSLLANNVLGLQIDSAGRLVVAGVTSTLSVPLDGAFHLVEVDGGLGGAGNAFNVWVDGVLFLSGTLGSAIALSVAMNLGVLLGTAIAVFDDVVIEDGPITPGGDYRNTLLRPVGDVAIGNWRRNNAASVYPMSPVLAQTPPKGVAVTSTLGENYVQNAVSGTNGSAADTLEVELEPIGGVGIAFTGPITTPRSSHERLTATTTHVAVSFTAPAGASGLRSVNVLMGKFGAPTDDVKFEIRQDVAGTPSASILSSGVFSAVPLPATTTPSAMVERSVMLDAAVTAGSRYWLVMTRSGTATDATSPTAAMSGAVGTGGYPGEGRKLLQNGVWTSLDTTFALYFDNAVWTPTQAQADTVDALSVVPFVNTAQQVTTGSPKSGAINVVVADQSNPPPGVGLVGNIGFATTSARQIAQPFRTQGQSPRSVVFAATASAGSVPITDAVIEFYADAGDAPSGTALFTSAPFTVTTTRTVLTVDTSAATLSPATRYWVLFRRTSGTVDALNINTPYIDGGATGLDGFVKYLNVSSVWVAYAETLSMRIVYGSTADTTFDYGLPNGQSGGSTAAAQGIFPVGWGTNYGAGTEPLGVGLTASPKLRVKRTGTYSRVVSADFAAAYVVWKTAAPLTRNGSGSGMFSSTGAATGKEFPSGSGSGTFTFTGAAAGSSATPTKQGSATGAFTFTGAALGAEPARGTATGTFTVTGLASGKEPARGTSAGTFTFTGASTGKEPARGTATGTVTFTGAASGFEPARGTATGTWTFTGASTGTALRRGTAAGTTTFTGLASGRTVRRGAATGTVTFTGSASGVTAKRGSSTGSFTFTGGAAGTTLRRSSGTGSWTFTGTASSAAVRAGSATGTWTPTGASSGTKTPKAVGSGTFTTTGTSSGVRTPKASAAGTATFTGAASGQFPKRGAATGTFTFAGQASSVGARTGLASGVFTFNGTAAGVSLKRGTTAGTWTFTGASTGRTIRKGTASGSWTYTGAASGRKITKGTATGSFTTTGVASGAALRRGTATGTFTATGTASGVKPEVGINDGAAVGTVTFTGLATGLVARRGGAAGTVNYTGLATGSTVKRGTATGTSSWTGAAVGKKVTNGSTASIFRLTGAGTGSTLRSGDAVADVFWSGSAFGEFFASASSASSWSFSGAANSGSSAMFWNGSEWRPCYVFTWNQTRMEWVQAKLRLFDQQTGSWVNA